MLIQENLYIDDLIIPVIREEGEIYYPVSHLSEKVLLRNAKLLSTHFRKYNKHKICYKQIDYGFGGVHESVCVTEETLKELLSNTKVGRLSVEQRKQQNKLHKYFGLPLISEDEKIVDTVHKDILNNYSIFIQDCISATLKEDPNVKWQQCTKCNNYYPLHKNFYGYNLHSSKEFNTVCYECWGKGSKFNAVDYYNIYYEYGEDFYQAYRDHEVITIYEHYIKNDISQVPEGIRNKDDYLAIVKHLYNQESFKEKHLTLSNIMNATKLDGMTVLLNIEDIYEHLFGEDYLYYPYKYPIVRNGDHTYLEAKKIFNYYIKENNITINKMFDFPYGKTLDDARVRIRDKLGFIVYYYDYQYPGYMFKVKAKNYYRDKNNRMFDLKYLVEQHMKIPIEKIPLYLTFTAIRNNGGNTMYHALKNYYKSLFEWVNEVYPDQFIETDFNINIIRNEFDSAEESQIHDVLKENFTNVIYNKRNTDRTIKINGMIPDWIILTDNNCWLVEYFGMYQDKSYNTRVRDYVDKTKIKIEKYNALVYYRTLFVYPDDLKKNMAGLYRKIKEIE